MAKYTLTPATVPPTLGYPGNLQDLLETIKNYMTVTEGDSSVSVSFLVGSTQPTASSGNQDKIWFELTPAGAPKAIRLFKDGVWQEFTPLKQGDMVLTADTVVPQSPWGKPNTTYQVKVYSGNTVVNTSYLTPAAPGAPTGFAYKVYVGHYV